MKSRPWIVALASLVLAANVALAGPLDKKQTSTLKRAHDQNDNTEKSLGDYGEGARWGVMTERVEADFARKVERAKTLLAGLPADNAEVKAELARLAKLEAAIAANVAVRTKKADAVAAAQGEVDALVNAPAFEADLAKLTAVHAQLENASWWQLDHYHFARWVDHSDIVVMRGWGTRWRETEAEYAALRAKYAKAITAALKGSSIQKLIKVREVADADAVKKLDEYKAELASFITGVPAAIEADGKTLDAMIKDAGSKGEFGAMLNPDGKIQAVRNRLVNIVSVYATVAPTADVDRVRTAATAAETGAATSIEKFADKVVAANTAPTNAYNGADRDKLDKFLRGAWKKKFPNDAILGVRFRESEFSRATEWVRNASGDGFSKRDYSTIRVAVIVKNGAKEASMLTVVLYKEHMKNDALEVLVGDKPKKLMPHQRLLLANFK